MNNKILQDYIRLRETMSSIEEESDDHKNICGWGQFDNLEFNIQLLNKSRQSPQILKNYFTDEEDGRIIIKSDSILMKILNYFRQLTFIQKIYFILLRVFTRR